jgi:hypothetical protein
MDASGDDQGPAILQSIDKITCQDEFIRHLAIAIRSYDKDTTIVAARLLSRHTLTRRKK